MAVETDNTKKLIKVCKVCQAYSVYIIFNVSYNQPNNQCKRLLKKFCFYVNGYVLFLLFQFYSWKWVFSRNTFQMQVSFMKASALIDM